MRKTILACVAVALIVGASTATAASLITSKDIKNGTIQSRDIKNGTIKSTDVKNGSIQSKDITKGTIKEDRLAAAVQAKLNQPGVSGSKGDKGDKGDKGEKGDKGPTLSAGNWGMINRNTIGSPVTQLRSGPAAPPLGTGSLNILVGDGTGVLDDLEKASFGNEIDYVGANFLDVDAVGYRVYTTGENIAVGGTSPNMPSITFEVDPNRAASASNFSSLVFTPANSPANQWSPYIDATTSGLWGGTGGAFTGSPCDLNGSRCTFAELQEFLDDGGDPPTIGSVAVTKGRDFSWQGAVDGLRVNDKVFDFEETGVVERTP